MGAGLKEQLGSIRTGVSDGGTQPPSLELLAELLLKRSLGIGILWLLGMSLFAVPGFCLAAVYAGFSMAFLISSMTVQAGLMGSISLPAFRIPADDILSSGIGGSLHMGDGSGK